MSRQGRIWTLLRYGMVLLVGPALLLWLGGLAWRWFWSQGDPAATAKEAFLQQQDWSGDRSQQLERMAALARQDPALQKKLYYFDAIVVCGAPARPNGSASLIQRHRLEKAQRLYRMGLAPWIIVSGNAVANQYVEARVMAREATRLGLPAAAILEEPWARHTTGNVRYSVIMGLQRRWRRLLVVSDWFHTLYVSFFTADGSYGGPARALFFQGIRTVALELQRCPTGGDRSPNGPHEEQPGAPTCPPAAPQPATQPTTKAAKNPSTQPATHP